MAPTKYFLLLVFLFLFIQSWSQSQPSLHIKHATSTIKLDAVLDDTDWQTTEVAKNFMQYFPADTSLAGAQTEVRVTYDEDFLYIAAKMYNHPGKRKYVTPSLRRDYRGEANDGFTVILDPFQDNTNAFQFGVNPFGVQREGLISNGGGNSDDLSLNWDNKWYAEAKIYNGFWIAEMAIPFKTLRFKEGSKFWNINFYRIDSEYAERSTWTPIPRNFRIISLANIGTLVWDEPLKKPGANISLIPYIAGSSTQRFVDEDNQRVSENPEYKLNVGGDAKIAINSGLNLDLTVNPDFSQVEVDEQVTNLDRFEIFFPERRQFFLENADLFSDFGDRNLRPFFSRRIGIVYDSVQDQNLQNAIPFGLRLSGKVNKNLRVGLLSMQGGKEPSLDLPATNYTVATMQHKIFSRSNISGIFVNKQAFLNGKNSGFTDELKHYNRTAGIDYNLASADGKWNGKFFYHHTFENNQPANAYALSGQISYNTLNWELNAVAQSVGDHFNPEVGFARRNGYQRAAGTISYRFYPNSSIINNHGPGFDFDALGNHTYGATDYDVNILYNISFQNTAMFRLRLRREYVYLQESFDPSGSDGLELPANTDYAYPMVIASYDSDRRQAFSFSFDTRIGDYFNGKRFFVRGSINYRFQPYGAISVDVNYNHIHLPSPYSSADLYLIGPRLDFTFSRSVFWTTFVQYNSQIDNININSRLQWRFKPVSDLFIVYTDNYFSDNFATKGRALVLKLTYWLNT